MKITELILKNFGKFTNKQILLSDGINIIYGENESGKTTLHTFLKGMLFGMERKRGRAAATDTFRTYEPWENPNFYAGILRFTCGDRRFRLERNFDRYAKGGSLICEDDGEELSLEHGDLEILLGGMTESDYENTVSIGQLRVQTGEILAAELKNYAANLGTTKSMEIDIKSAFADLDKQKKNIMIESRIAEEDVVEKAIKNAKEDLEISQGEQHTIIASIEQKKQSLFNLSNSFSLSTKSKSGINNSPPLTTNDTAFSGTNNLSVINSTSEAEPNFSI